MMAGHVLIVGASPKVIGSADLLKTITYNIELFRARYLSMLTPLLEVLLMLPS